MARHFRELILDALLLIKVRQHFNNQNRYTRLHKAVLLTAQSKNITNVFQSYIVDHSNLDIDFSISGPLERNADQRS